MALDILYPEQVAHVIEAAMIDAPLYHEDYGRACFKIALALGLVKSQRRLPGIPGTSDTVLYVRVGES